MSQAKRVSMGDSPNTSKKPSAPQPPGGSVPVLNFSTSAGTVDHSQLLSLSDKRSAYASVARTCLQLNQFDSSDTLIHNASYAKTVSAAHVALMECAQTHEDRRCRILACKTLALVARAAYARLRHSPMLFGIREPTRLQDEVGTDIPVALCSVALQDVDDGVSSCAVQALAILTLSNVGMEGTSVQDVLLREVQAIANTRPLPHAPTLQLLQDEDYCTPMMELQCRVYENVLSPRLWRLIRRILHYSSWVHIERTLPFITACLGHLVIHTSSSFGMDRTNHAKRWIEVDVDAMVHDVVSSLLLPAMQQNDVGLAHAAALCALRLTHVCPTASWVPQVYPWTVSVLVMELSASNVVEHKMATLATLLIALRGIPLTERAPTLEFVVNAIRFLPSTARVPAGVVSPGMVCEDSGDYRRPARVGLLSEVAVSFFVDSTGSDNTTRSAQLKKFLSSPQVTATLTARLGKKKRKSSRVNSNQSIASSSAAAAESRLNANAPGGKAPTEEYVGTHVGEEVVLSFCQVAILVGQKVMMSRKANRCSSHDLEDWLRCSLAVLSSFSSCINWKSRTKESIDDEEEDHDVQTLFTVLTAVQKSYICLFQKCLYTVGLLSPSSSVSLHLMPLAVSPNLLLLQEMAQATLALSKFEPVSGVDGLHKDLMTLADHFLEYKIREGVPSRHTRISLLALLTDHWVQTCHFATMGDGERPGTLNMNEMNAREILATLSEQVSSLRKEIHQEDDKSRHASSNQDYLRVCVACIENIALTACDWARRFGSNRASSEAFRMDIDEDSRYIVSVALAALDGKNLRDGDVLDEEKEEDSNKKPMLPLCVQASRRIQEVSGAGNSSSQVDAFGIGGKTPALFSSLVSAAKLELKTGLKYTPYLSTSHTTFLAGDASHHAYLAQYCQQVIASRFDMAIWSSPLADADDLSGSGAKHRIGGSDTGVDGQTNAVPYAIRSKNALRLSAPRLPSSRLPKTSWGFGRRLCLPGATAMVTAGSDPIAVVVSCAARRCPRYDCEPEYRLHVTIKLHNVTAVEIAKGVRVELSVTQEAGGTANSNGDASSEFDGQHIVLYSTSATYKQELNSGEHLMWEIFLPHMPTDGSITLRPTVTFRDLEAEQVGGKWVGTDSKEAGGEAADEDEEPPTKDESRASEVEEDGTFDVTLCCEPVQLSFMATFQPDPLVFFRDGAGDETVFRYLWFQLPYHVALSLVQNDAGTSMDNMSAPRDELADAVSKLSMLTLEDWMEPVGRHGDGWAFMTLSGKRLFCVLAMDGNVPSPQRQSDTATPLLQFRTDDEGLIRYLGRENNIIAAFVSALTKDKWRCADVKPEVLKWGLHI